MSFPSQTRLGVVVAAIALAACTDATGVGPAADSDRSPIAKLGASGRVPASIEWNEVARGLVAKNRSTPFVAFRVYAITSEAQWRALQAAELASTQNNHVSRRAAIAAASVGALSYLYPADAPDVEALLQQQVTSGAWLERPGIDAIAGEAVGRAVGAEVVEDAKADGYLDPFTGEVPTGAGFWYSSTVPPTDPSGYAIGDARTYFLQASEQFRPPPPPSYGSAEFAAALAEVRQISDTRTVEQDSIARYWGMGAGTHTPPGHWNLEASTLARKHGYNEGRAARLLALLNMVAMDAIVASHDAKYYYWLIRPSQEDPAITLSLPLPNFPAYPSNHATISAAMVEVLAKSFPAHSRRLRGDADEAALSRVYGGIHYRFDGDAGLALGRQVARFALEQDARGNWPLARH
jgi:membrane-associated phospholipid phosphatase